MSLAHLLPLLDSIPVPYQTSGGPGIRWTSDDLTLASRPAAIAAFVAHASAPVLVVVPRQEAADALVANLSQLLPPTIPTLAWRAADPLPYEQMPHDPVLSAQRSAILGRLIQHDARSPLVIVSTIRALMTHIRSRESFVRDMVQLRVGQRLDDAALVRHLTAAGYSVESLVDSPGLLSRRGGILDVFSPGYDDAIRLELFGDELDSLRRFDPVTQRSVERLANCMILPPIEYDLSDRASARARLRSLPLDTLREEVRDEWQRMVALLEAGAIPASVDLIASQFPGNDATLLNYLSEGATIIRIEPQAIKLQAEQIALQAEEVHASLEQAREIPAGIGRPYADWARLDEIGTHWQRWDIGAGSDGVRLPTADAFGSISPYGGNIDDVIATVRQQTDNKWRVVLATEQSERLSDVLEEHEIYPRVLKRGGAGAASPPLPGAVDVVHAPLGAGFSVPGTRLLVLTDLEIFGLRKIVRAPLTQAKRRTRSTRQFVPGSYVVHVDHGVGLLQGLVTLDLSGAEREYLQIDYAEGDRLYVPVDQSDRLMPYESPAGTPKVTRLSSAEWSRIKARVRQAVREMAFELLQIYASREIAVGHAFPDDSAWDVELEESFPFRETAEQQSAIDEVKSDMESPQPMDRLICGDVGYGKTEVALRAAFKAANDGMQVAILVPTTILALQHYNTFRERLAPFPVTVEMLSRLRTKPQQAEITARLESGGLDIIIGTHRLLQKDVRFRNLGLLIVDEEQRFGVRHKEHIKQMRAEIDVLTMTATPIPRTLHMALAGIRDLSLITTPPQDRVPVRTFVTASNDNIVREAIMRELARGGQVYFVHNRVHSIERICAHLRDLVPEARFEIAHGQMHEDDLERIVLAFMRQEFDVLVCTTIIESGVDIPNANTIILDNAHALGLTQMYQLRGRVGRSTNRAYAYLLYPPHTPLSAEALERLEAIQEATELGAGFQVALRDMEIRGAGNILGAQQSGHIAAVGFDLYTRMLAHAVEEIRAGHPIAEPEDISIDIAVEAGIPDNYVPDERIRLELYQRIASAANEKALQDADGELRDRFGTPPLLVERLFDLVRLRHRATRLGLTSIVERDGDIIIRPVVGSKLSQQRLRSELGPGVRITPNQVRLRIEELIVERRPAVMRVLDAIVTARASLLQDAESEESDSSSADSKSSIMARASSA